MKLALLTRFRSNVPPQASRGHLRAFRSPYWAFLRWRAERRLSRELNSFYRTAEAMGLNPNGPLPPFLKDKILRTHQILNSLTGITYPLPKQP